jgi:hypothetical protein
MLMMTCVLTVEDWINLCQGLTVVLAYPLCLRRLALSFFFKFHLSCKSQDNWG